MVRARRVCLASTLFAFFAAGFAPPARAEGERNDPAALYDVSLPIDGFIIVASSAAILVPYALSSRLITPTCPCASSSVNPIDRGVIGNASNTADTISNVTVGLAILAPPVADWLALGASRTLLDDVIVFTESLTLNSAVNTAVKYAVQRPIPRAYSDPQAAASPSSYRSFYSGHTSLAFAALSTASVTLDKRYGFTWQPWAVSVLIGASVGAERVLAGYHFYTDVVAGAVAGTAVGTLVPIAHLRSHRLRISIFRPETGEGAGIQIGGLL